MPFTGKVLGQARNGEFTEYEPAHFVDEQLGMNSWDGPGLDYIRVNTGWIYSHPLLAPNVMRLIESTWKHAQPKEGHGRSKFTVGGHRGKSIQPDTFHAASAINFDLGAEAMPQFAPTNVAPHLRSVVPQDWKVMNDIPRVSAYAFRGDTRGPDQIWAAGGFRAPDTRTDDSYIANKAFPHFQKYFHTKTGLDITLDDFSRFFRGAIPQQRDRIDFSYYCLWRGLAARESMHIGRMVAKEDMKGYVSTTRAVPVAKGFAGAHGHVYCCLIPSGFNTPTTKEGWFAVFGEQEIAVPVPVPATNIMGYRAMEGKKFTGSVFFRTGFDRLDNLAFQKCYLLLSGHKQPMGE